MRHLPRRSVPQDPERGRRSAGIQDAHGRHPAADPSHHKGTDASRHPSGGGLARCHGPVDQPWLGGQRAGTPEPGRVGSRPGEQRTDNRRKLLPGRLGRDRPRQWSPFPACLHRRYDQGRQGGLPRVRIAHDRGKHVESRQNRRSASYPPVPPVPSTWDRAVGFPQEQVKQYGGPSKRRTPVATTPQCLYQ